jgi:cytoskeleton protein RodZ
VWGTLLVLVAAVALAFLPESWLGSVLRGRGLGTAPAASAPPVTEVVTLPASAVAPSAAAAPAASAAVEEAPAASAPAPAAAPTQPVAAAAPSVLAVSAGAETWVEVQDARGQMLLSRSLGAGESVSVDGAPPLRVTIGNALATRVTFRGNAVDLARHTRDNVARLQLN